MQYRFISRVFLMMVGIALLFAGLFFDTGAAFSQTEITSTPDRLAQPTLPADPSQADQGSQVYWLSCLPCHGDRGQGLTDEFRKTYPVEDQNCWVSGCHGKRPYDNGFTLPTAVPAIVGSGTLQKFENAAMLRSYIFAAMPYWKPASLTEEETWQVTAFLLRENKLWDAKEDINASNADLIHVGPPQATSTPQVFPAKISETPFSLIAVVFAFFILIVIFFVFRAVQKRSVSEKKTAQ